MLTSVRLKLPTRGCVIQKQPTHVTGDRDGVSGFDPTHSHTPVPPTNVHGSTERLREGVEGFDQLEGELLLHDWLLA